MNGLPITELTKRITENPFRAVGLAFALGLSLGMGGRPSKQRGLGAALFAGGMALGLRMLRNVAVEQVMEALKSEVLGDKPGSSTTAKPAGGAAKETLVH